MKKYEKPFDMINASFIPNQLFDNRCMFLTNQQKVFLIFLYRKLYGYGKTEIQLSYSVIFNDFPCIIKNKHKFSEMIKDLENKGLIKITRGYKKCHKYTIKEEQYKKLVDLSQNYTGETENEKIIENISTGIETGSINLDDNTIETLQYVYQYEYNKLYPKLKCNFTNDRYIDKFIFLKQDLDEIKDIHYKTFIRCYFHFNYFDENKKPSIEDVYNDYTISNYERYKDILLETPLEDDTMKYLFLNVYEGYLSLNNKSIMEYIEKYKTRCLFDNISYNELFYCSKTYIDVCQNINEEKYNKVIEKIEKYPVIIKFIKNILKDDFVLSKYVKPERKKVIENVKKIKEKEQEITQNDFCDIDFSNFKY